MRRVRIGTCSGPAEAALVRAAMNAHDIPVLINAEQHASMLGGLGGAFVPLHVYVDEADAERATALLREIRAEDGEAAIDEAELTAAALGADAPPDADADADALAATDDDDRALIAARAARRRRAALLLVVGYGSAVAIPFLIGRPPLAIALIAAVLGAMVLTLRAGRPRPPQLPRARLRRR